MFPFFLLTNLGCQCLRCGAWLRPCSQSDQDCHSWIWRLPCQWRFKGIKVKLCCHGKLWQTTDGIRGCGKGIFGAKEVPLAIWRLVRKTHRMKSRRRQTQWMSCLIHQSTFQESNKAVVSILCFALTFILACGGRFLIFCYCLQWINHLNLDLMSFSFEAWLIWKQMNWRWHVFAFMMICMKEKAIVCMKIAPWLDQCLDPWPWTFRMPMPSRNIIHHGWSFLLLRPRLSDNLDWAVSVLWLMCYGRLSADCLLLSCLLDLAFCGQMKCPCHVLTKP